MLEIEAYSQNVAREQIELNKKDAKKHLEDTVERMKNEFQRDKKNAIEKTIEIEKKNANSKLEEQKRYGLIVLA